MIAIVIVMGLLIIINAGKIDRLERRIDKLEKRI